MASHRRALAAGHGDRLKRLRRLPSGAVPHFVSDSSCSVGPLRYLRGTAQPRVSLRQPWSLRNRDRPQPRSECPIRRALRVAPSSDSYPGRWLLAA